MIQTSFNNYCNCGGFAATKNERPMADPHMAWCPQREEIDHGVALEAGEGASNEHDSSSDRSGNQPPNSKSNRTQ